MNKTMARAKLSRIKWPAAGAIAAVLCVTGLAYAAGAMTPVTAFISAKLSVKYNGADFNPAEADGTKIPAFLYNDRTYLPVRAVAELSGVYVDYDDSEEWVIIKSENSLLNRANLVLHYLKYGDYKQLAGYVHKSKGVTFSPYAYVEGDAVRMAAGEVETLKPGDMYTWGGYDGTGDAMELSVADYSKKFVYNQDFINAPRIGVGALIQTGNSLSNLDAAFPGASFVEYNFPGIDEENLGMDWASLRLVFEKEGGQWMLIGVVHDCWTI